MLHEENKKPWGKLRFGLDSGQARWLPRVRYYDGRMKDASSLLDAKPVGQTKDEVEIEMARQPPSR